MYAITKPHLFSIQQVFECLPCFEQLTYNRLLRAAKNVNRSDQLLHVQLHFMFVQAKIYLIKFASLSAFTACLLYIVHEVM